MCECIVERSGHNGFNPAWKEIDYVLPMRSDYEEPPNVSKHHVKDCPFHADKDLVFKMNNELKSLDKMFSMRSETNDGLPSCSNFPERPSSYELESDKVSLPEIEHLRGKMSEEEFESLKAVFNRNADVFSKHKTDNVCCNFVEHENELEEGAVPHTEGGRSRTPHKSQACREEIELLLEYDMIEPSKSPWACGVVMAKKKGEQPRFSLSECGDHKGRLSTTTYRRDPLGTLRCQVFR